MIQRVREGLTRQCQDRRANRAGGTRPKGLAQSRQRKAMLGILRE